MTNQKVSFIELTQSEYDNSLKHSDNAFYYCTDTHNFYKGDNAIGGGSLPEVTSADNGDTLIVVNGGWTKSEFPTELPAVSAADDGKLLGVEDGHWDKIDAPSGGDTLVLTARLSDDRTVKGSSGTVVTESTVSQLISAGATVVYALDGLAEYGFTYLYKMYVSDGAYFFGTLYSVGVEYYIAIGRHFGNSFSVTKRKLSTTAA